MVVLAASVVAAPVLALLGFLADVLAVVGRVAEVLGWVAAPFLVAAFGVIARACYAIGRDDRRMTRARQAARLAAPAPLRGPKTRRAGMVAPAPRPAALPSLAARLAPFPRPSWTREALTAARRRVSPGEALEGRVIPPGGAPR